MCTLSKFCKNACNTLDMLFNAFMLPVGRFGSHLVGTNYKFFNGKWNPAIFPEMYIEGNGKLINFLLSDI